MNPIFKDYCQFINEMVINKEYFPELNEIKEGYFWLDRQIIKCFDKDNKIHKILKIDIANDLRSVSISKPAHYSKLYDVEIIGWDEMVTKNIKILQQKENESLRLIRDKSQKFCSYTKLIPSSTGKDSMLTMHLVRMVFPDTKVIFNNTTLDCADTYKMAKSLNNCEIMSPTEGFYQYLRRINVIPTRFARFCCRIFKVGEMVNQLDKETPYIMFLGMRNEESSTRSSYEDEWINESEWGKTKWQGILPIRKWSELEVWLYTLWKDIPINPKYKKGYSRCGCHIACPYYAKSTWILDCYWYKKSRQRWEEILSEDFIKNKKWLVMNCTKDEYVSQAWNGGAFRDEPTSDVVEEFAQYSSLEYRIAEQYFNKYCTNGCRSNSGKLKKIKDKDTIAMNLKLNGRSVSKFMCKKCLMKYHELSNEKWDSLVSRFKQSGCNLF